MATKDAQGNTVTPKDTLPGIGASQLVSIRTNLGGYVTAQTTHATDGERPFSAANTGLRRRLHLPTDRGMS